MSNWSLPIFFASQYVIDSRYAEGYDERLPDLATDLVRRKPDVIFMVAPPSASAIGTVTNLAARLCGEAKPGQVLISRRLLATVEHLVEAEPGGELALKGFHRPVTGYNVLRLKE